MDPALFQSVRQDYEYPFGSLMCRSACVLECGRLTRQQARLIAFWIAAEVMG